MSKLNNKIVLISVLVITVTILFILISRKEHLKIKFAEDEMPDFKFQLIDGGFIQKEDIDICKFTLMCFFNSDCDFCISGTQELVDSISLLNNCQIVMVSYEDSIKVTEFYEKFRLMDFPQIQVACVPEDYVYGMFKIYVIPTLYVYNPDKSMKKYKPGPVTVHEIVQYLK